MGKLKTFWDYVNKTPTCWLWTGGTSKGYGVVKRGGKNAKAHRVSYALARGSTHLPPSNKVVRHTCHEPLCVNPAHLVLGTVRQNNADRRKRREQAELEMAGSGDGRSA